MKEELKVKITEIHHTNLLKCQTLKYFKIIITINWSTFDTK